MPSSSATSLSHNDSPITSPKAPTRPERSAFIGVGEFVINPLVVVLITVGSFYFGGWFLLAPLLFVFGFIPVLDQLVGTDTFNPSEEMLAALGEKKVYRAITMGYVVVQAAVLCWALWQVRFAGMSSLEFTLLGISVGVLTGGIGITFAHELCHKTQRVEQLCGQALLMMVCYMHFHIEHNLGHHVNVSTPRDPASSRFGESFYRFYPRSVIQGYRSAWRIERRRLERAHKALWGIHNQMLWFALLPLLLAALIGALVGWMGVLFFFLQSFVAFSLLEIVNYLEHYGLERRELSPGRFERVSPLHSWNSNNRVTNGFLIMLQRHSDHHANAQRRYQTLRNFDESPQLPTGYAGMVLLALVPPLWFKVMNPRVLDYRARLDALRSSSGGQG